MALRIQDPTDPQSEYLIDSLLDACNGAEAGGGAFAFLSSGGVRLLLKDARFTGFVDHGSFDLIVGVDAITNVAAVNELAAVQHLHPNLGARVLIPAHPRSIFHPKFAWFDHGNGGVLLTGSGNLTAGGLRWNIEAFSIQELSAENMASLRGQWDAFLQRTAACQRDPNDAQVVALLERNAARRRAMREAGIEVPAEVEGEIAGEPKAEAPGQAGVDAAAEVPMESVDEVPTIDDTTPVLVAEIPKGTTDGRMQANFSKEMFINFFGASETVQRNAYLFHVRGDGTLGEHELRPAVVTKSHNYRFELRAGKGLAYPAASRPIGLFIRVAARTFLYMLLMPGAQGYPEVAQLLDSRAAPGPNMRRIEFNAAAVRAAWPGAPLWQRLTL